MNLQERTGSKLVVVGLPPHRASIECARQSSSVAGRASNGRGARRPCGAWLRHDAEIMWIGALAPPA
jgi:hypothetical protein